MFLIITPILVEVQGKTNKFACVLLEALRGQKVMQ